MVNGILRIAAFVLIAALILALFKFVFQLFTLGLVIVIILAALGVIHRVRETREEPAAPEDSEDDF